MKKLYIGNLPYTTTDDELKELFSKVGAVLSAKVITDRDSGRSKGFGFVEMENDAEAEKAIAEYNGQKPMGDRALVVNEARPMQPRDNNRGGGGGMGGGYGSRNF